MLFYLFAAPGDYIPEKSASLLLDNSPKYSFGLKTQLGRSENSPGMPDSNNFQLICI